MNDKITVLIPTYRRPELLRRAILSVLRQTYSNLQVSVFDNASGDNTEEVVRRLSANDSRIKYHCHAHNIGAIANFKYAFKSVDTPYFSILSDDDFLAKDFYENAINVFKDNPEVMFVILNTLIVDENANLIGNREGTHRLSLYQGKKGFDAMHSGNIPLTWTAMVFKRELAQLYADMDDRYDIASDMRFLFRAASRYNFAYLSKVGAFFTDHAGSFSITRKSIDPVHQGVQISRYVEIIHDEHVPQDIRDGVVFHIRKLLSQNLYKPAAIGSLIRLMKNFCNATEPGNNRIEADIRDIRYAGYVKTSVILNYLHKNNLAKNIIRMLFGSYYKQRVIQHQMKMLALKNSTYKELFEDIKKINS